MRNNSTHGLPSLRHMRASVLAGLAGALLTGACAVPLRAADPPAGALKANFALKDAFSTAAKTAAQSTVRVLVLLQDPDKPDKADRIVPAAYGTVITSDGFILTKGSEVINHKKIFVKLGGNEVEAKVVGVRESYDLAMLKVDAKGLTPVTLADTAPPATPAKPAASATVQQRGGRGFGRVLQQPTGPIPTVAAPASAPAGEVAVTVGEFVITPEAAASEKPQDRDKLAPKNYGVISVQRRSIPFSSGVLGVALALQPSMTPPGALVTEVYMQSGAGRAGVKPEDVITAVDDSPVDSRAALQNLIRRHYPTDVVTLTVARGDQTLSLRVQLGDAVLATPEDIEMAVLSGSVNARSSDFQAVFQHDTVLAPTDMGGPLVDLDGRVIGINIARAGRTETYAIPADLLTERWLDSMKDGTFAPHSKP